MSSLWLSDTKIFESIPVKYEIINDFSTDVCIIGAGIFGLSCGYYLTKLGYKVTILEKSDISSKTTGHTTGKITSQHGLFYDYLTNSYGQRFAKDYLNVNEDAIKNIKDIIDEENINCDFRYQNNYVYTTNQEEVPFIKKECDAVSNLDYNCEFVTKVGLPFEIAGAICFRKQAQFNPIKYIAGLSNCITKKSGEIYVNTIAIDIKMDGSDYITYANNHKITSKYVIIATHYPFINFPGFYFTKMYQSTSYLIAINPNKSLFNGMYISALDPVFSFRTAVYNKKEVLLIGGQGHKTGYPSSYQDTYGILEDIARKYYPSSEVLFKWNTRDCISLDKIPYIGSFSSSMPNIFVGTGFKKWGMTLSNVASNIIVDKICGNYNKYAYLFKPSRIKPIKNHDEFKNMLVQSVNSLLVDKFRRANMDFDQIANNSGSIIDVNGEKVGIYKDENGKIYAVKPICTHLGCLLSWNDVDKTWDCPCHGSRFNFDGKNLYDPAFIDLETYDL